jgi:ribosome-associated protein
MSNITDFFVICSGNSTRQVKAITDYIIERFKEYGHKIYHIEGYEYAFWVLLDCGDVVVHLFHTPTRNFYDLEHLWVDAPQISLNDKSKK